MSDRAHVFNKEEYTAASNVTIVPSVQCPGCKSEDLILHGYMSYPHRETVSGGKTLEQETDWEFKDAFELTTIECTKCSTRFKIRDDEKFRLEKDNSILRAALAKITGKDPYGAGNIC